MRRSAIKTGRRSIDRGSTFAARPRELARESRQRRERRKAAGEPVPCSPLKQTARKRRDHDVVTADERTQWHLLVCRSRLCVRDGCDRPAGPHGHHAVEKQWLLSHPLLRGHAWDLAVGVGACEPCHSRYTTRLDPITRGELVTAGYWQTLVGWARMLDARYFRDGHEPVLARLERDYPEPRAN